MLPMLLSCKFLTAFSSVCPVPAILNLYKFFWSITFKNVQIFHQNSTFMAKTHVYTKPLTPYRRLPLSNAHLVTQ